MGRKIRSEQGLANALFARVQLRVLALLYCDPDRAFHASELIRLARSGSGAVQRELKTLSDAGILSITLSGNRKLYQANRQSPIFSEVRGLIIKTVGVVEPLRHALKAFASDIEAAFVYGSIAKGTDTVKSDIDLMIVGNDLTYSEIYLALQKAEKSLGRPVSPNVIATEEWRQKLANKAAFVSKIFQQPKLFVFGTENELKRIG